MRIIVMAIVLTSLTLGRDALSADPDPDGAVIEQYHGSPDLPDWVRSRVPNHDTV